MEFIKAKLMELQHKGVPFLFIRDRGVPSVTLSLVIISAIMIIVGLIGRASGLLGGIDMQSALWWHGMSLGAYLNRKYSKDKGLGTSKDNSENINK